MSPMPDFAKLVRHWVLHPLEALLVYALFGLFGLMSIDRASAIGAWIGRTLGPRLPVTARAQRNLRIAFPDKSDAEIDAIVAGMWDHLGRVAAEYPHLPHIVIGGRDRRVIVHGTDVIDLVRDDGKPAVCFSAHLGNWELASMVATWRNLPLTRVYRAANNRFVDRLVRHSRRAISGTLVPKGSSGAREALATLNGKGHVALLVDQKLNDGIAVPFFGRDAMTAPAVAQLALKFDCPVIPVRVERLEGARFLVTVYPPLVMPRTGDRPADIRAGMARINQVLEGWIRERPEQWLWLHRRWPES